MKRSPTLLRVIAVAALFPFLLAACGSSGSGGASVGGPSATASQSGQVDKEQALLDWAVCIREQGITSFEDPTVDSDGNVHLQLPEGVDTDVFRNAAETCHDELAGLDLKAGRSDPTATQDAFIAFANCMRENGVVDFPDPVFSNRQPPLDPSLFDRNDPSFQKAYQACQSDLAALPLFGGRS
jgi:hypothetical protein